MYSDENSDSEQLVGAICIETDDLLGGGIGHKFDTAMCELRKIFTFGTW